LSRVSRLLRLSPTSGVIAGDTGQHPRCPTATGTDYFSASSPKHLPVSVSLVTLLLLVFGLISGTVQAAVKEFQQPNAYAVVIGISHYREEVIPKVAYAVNDAEAVAKLLETQAGIPRANIKLLTDAKATLGDFRNYFSGWLRMRVEPTSTVYVYFAGHGTPNPRTGESYLVPWDGHPDFPIGLYPLNDLYETLDKLPGKEVIVILDSCFSGVPGRSVLAKGARPMGLSVENPLLPGGKVTVLAAATGTQISSDYDKGEHGLFTHYLLAALRGEADADRDGVVSLGETFNYVRVQVAKTALNELNREQTPVLLPGETMLGPRIATPLSKGDHRLMEEAIQREAVRRAEQELKALQDEERQVEEQQRLKAIQQEIEEKKKQIAEKKKNIEVARVRPYQAPGQLEREIIGQDGAPVVLVPAGEFTMGEGAGTHKVSLDAFYIDKYEVTTTRYAKFLAATGRELPLRWNQVSQASDGERPVVGINWHDADAYCRWTGKRLPTEAEWEKAARGTDARKYPWGNEEPSRSLANYDSDGKRTWQGYSTVSPVGAYESAKSPYSAHDMAGNVWEWVADWYDADYYKSSPDQNPKRPSTGQHRVARGGSWFAGPTSLRSAGRDGVPPSRRSPSIGVRCAQDAQ